MAIHVAYNLSLETSFLADECATYTDGKNPDATHNSMPCFRLLLLLFILRLVLLCGVSDASVFLVQRRSIS